MQHRPPLLLVHHVLEAHLLGRHDPDQQHHQCNVFKPYFRTVEPFSATLLQNYFVWVSQVRRVREKFICSFLPLFLGLGPSKESKPLVGEVFLVVEDHASKG